MRKYLILLFLVFAAVVPCETAAQSLKRNSTFQAYIDKYVGMAMDQMQRYGIPASITLAQGLLESGAGQSMLAVKANNHFGIKVTTDWTGKYILRDDDKPNEKFRVYSSPAESYEDHSLFLKRRRYQQLYSLSPTDYKGWARGLKDCGYATSSSYATNLINIIELYELYRYDTGELPTYLASTDGCVSAGLSSTGTAIRAAGTQIRGIQDIIHFCNGSRFVIAQPGDTWELLSKYYGISLRKLRKINELPKGILLNPGDIVFLDTKSTKADKIYKKRYHVVRLGESIYSISQTYGMKMKTLYKVNKLSTDYMPRPGDNLRLR